MLNEPRDVHRAGVIVCPVCARFGRDDCKEHRATAVAALEAMVEDRPWWMDMEDEDA